MQRDFCEIKFLVDICEHIVNLSFSLVLMDNCQYVAHYVLTWQKRGGCGHVILCFDSHSFFVPRVGKINRKGALHGEAANY